MTIQQIIHDVGPDGNICLNLPDFIGKKVRIVFSDVKDSYIGDEMKMDDEQEFDAVVYLAAFEDDEAEDAIWEKYIQ